MTPSLKSQPGPESSTNHDDKLNHWECCIPDVGLCGSPLSDDECDEEDINCVVCIDLEDLPCGPNCTWKGWAEDG